MAQYTAYVNYWIFFSDQAEYDFAVAIVGGNLIQIAPRTAQAMFDINFSYGSGGVGTLPKGIYFEAPYHPANEIGHPAASGIFLDDTVDFMIIPGQGGNGWPIGPDIKLVWSGNIIKSNYNGGGTPPINVMSQRRWIGSPEWEPIHEGGTGIATTNLCRDCSRTIDGHGMAIRGANNTNIWNRTLAEYRTGLVTGVSWERFYVRFRNPGAVSTGFWRCHGFPSNAAGAGLLYTAAGLVELVNMNAASVQVSAGTVPVNLNEWYKFDVLVKYASGGGTDGRIIVYIDSLLAFTLVDAAGYGMNSNSRHMNSDLGKWFGVDANVEIDLDDWICADLPFNCDPLTLAFIDDDFPIDWLAGSHVRRVHVASADLTGWTGNQGVLGQGVDPQTNLANTATSSTSGATLENITDAPTQDIQDTIGTAIGAVAAVIGNFSKNAGGTDGQLGYKVAGGAAVLVTINQTAADAHFSAAYQPSGQVLPTEINPFSAVHTKSLDGNLDTTTSLVAAVEYIGTWGPEDDVNFEYEINRLTFLHNCRYGNTAWGYVGSVPDAPCYSVGGTYVGNGTYQEINLPAPCHFLWIRPITGAPTGGLKFFGASLNAHFGAKDRVIPNFRMWADSAGQPKFSVSGTSIECNQNAIVYQYIAFCDPGMRFNLCGAYNHGSTGASPRTNPLICDDFLPIGGFVQSEILGTISNTIGLFYKGPGHAGSAGNSLGSGSVANFGTFGLGFFNSESNLHLSTGQMNYSLWRSVEPNCSGTMVQMFSYVGDNTNPRVIPCTPISGRFPLFILVVPVAATASFYRDPSHAGTNSANADTLTNNAATAIVGAGMDSITVHSAINALGTVYNVFVICGSTAGMINGEFFKPNCDPPEGPYVDPSPIIVDIAVMGEGGLTLGGAAPLTLLKDISGIYTLVPGKTNDTLYDRLTGQANIDVKIPDPNAKTGYIGG